MRLSQRETLAYIVGLLMHPQKTYRESEKLYLGYPDATISALIGDIQKGLDDEGWI